MVSKQRVLLCNVNSDLYTITIGGNRVVSIAGTDKQSTQLANKLFKKAKSIAKHSKTKSEALKKFRAYSDKIEKEDRTGRVYG